MLVTPPLTNAQLQAMTLLLAGVGAPMRVLWYKIGADMNVTTDQAFTKNGTFTNYILGPNGHIRVVNPSASCALCVGGIYSSTSKGGDAVLAASQTYGAVTGANTGTSVTGAVPGLALRSDANLYLSLSTPAGGAATADWYILGIPLS